jgi:two-component system sensor histidine kinase KdpD
LVDISVEEMHRRMREGNIYPAAQARMALQNFFRTGNLTALRELALRRTAENVDTALERYMAAHEITPPWAATERIMVAADHRPFSKDLIRRGWHLARGLKAPLLVVHVANPAQPPAPEDATGLHDNLELAEDLGAEVVTIPAGDVPAALARVAREHNVTQIVLGHQAQSAWHELLRPSTATRLLRLVTQDVHLVSPPRRSKNSAGGRTEEPDR